MAYDFFLSYTRANNDAFLQSFFEALSQAIRDRRGLAKSAVVGFFDQRDLELGEQWDQSIVEALQTSSVLLAVASPAYFKSEYCGKEWELFRRRIAAIGSTPLPPLIKPIVWIPFNIATLPSSVTGGQLTFGDPQAVQNERGFKYLLKNFREHEITFNNLVEALAQQITDAADRHAVGGLQPVPQLQQVSSAFSVSTANVQTAQPIRTGPKHVRFVYVAADPHAFGAARASEAYVDNGGADWKPFFPDDTRRIHRLTQNFVSNDELDFTSEELRFGQNLLYEIQDAWSKRQIVVLVVDGWSVQWDAQYRSVLSQLDSRLDYHWCVLVPRNEKDQDAMRLRKQIDDAISQTFDRHANLAPNPLFFRDNIKSAADFLSQLRDVLIKLKEEIKKRAPVDMPVPIGPSRRVITGP